MKENEIKKTVRKRYAGIVKQQCSCCGDATSTCCGSNTPDVISKGIGYTDEELKAVPQGANLGLGCGNPVALASLRKGETVLDLGSGAGFDCFLAADRVGSSGRVIGVDMTPEMLAAARENAEKGNYSNVEFRLGEIENLPVADNTADVIISNCVINLSPDKRKVFAEAFRVLKPGGRLMVSDIVLLEELPDFIKNSMAAYVACVGGAVKKDEYLAAIKAAGFKDVRVVEETSFPTRWLSSDSAQEIIEDSGIPRGKIEKVAGSVVSIKVCGIK